MGAYDGNPGNELAYIPETRSLWNPKMVDGIGNLADKFFGLGLHDSSTDSLFQVMKAVDAAEITVKHQVEENNRLRTELQKKTQELERYALEIWCQGSIARQYLNDLGRVVKDLDNCRTLLSEHLFSIFLLR